MSNKAESLPEALSAASKHSGSFVIVKCQACQMTFVQNPLTSEEEKEVDLIEDFHEEFPGSEGRHRYMARMLMKEYRDNPGLRVLEVGCGYGALLRIVRDAKLPYEAIELSPWRVKMLEEAGYSVVRMTLQEFSRKNPGKKYDIVIIDNVLEHIIAPRQFVEGVVDLLAEQGRIIVSVPGLYDIRRWLVPGWAREYLWQPKRHVNYFSGRTLSALFGLFGLQAGPFPLLFPSGLDIRQIILFFEIFLERILPEALFGHYKIFARERR